MNYYYTHFDSLFEELAGDFYKPLQQVAKETNTVKLPSYPPCDCVVSEDRNTLGLRFAMAGYSKSEVSVVANEGSVSVQAKACAEEDGFETIHNGISKKPINFTVGVDNNYDAKKAKGIFENGMLFIELPCKKEAEAVKLM